MKAQNPTFSLEAILKEARKGMEQANAYTLKELSTLHAGKASPGMVQHVSVDLGSGNTLPLQQMAMITTPDPHTILVEPWEKDKMTIEKVAKALQTANLGTNPVVQGTFIRCPLPELSRERRLELCKKAQEITETVGHKGVRLARQKAMDAAKAAPSEDIRGRLKDQIETMSKDVTQRLRENLEEKKKELLPNDMAVVEPHTPKKKKKGKKQR